MDAIFIVRQIMEKAREHNVPIHFNFIDFKAAFDTVWREALWRMLKVVGVSGKVVNIIRSLYRDTECAFVVDGCTSEWFRVGVRVRQGCLLSPAPVQCVPWSLLWESWGHWMERSPTMQRWQWTYSMRMIPPCYLLCSENWRLPLRNWRWPAEDGV